MNKNHIKDRWLAGLGSFFLSALVVGVGFIPTGSAHAREHPAANPDLQKACGLNVLMILDESTSINMAGATNDVRNAFKAFTAAIKNTSSSMAVAEFSTMAHLPSIGGAPAGEYITITDATKVDLDHYVDHDYYPTPLHPNSGINYTNWEDGLRMGIPNHAPRNNYQVPHLTVFITDGEPNRMISHHVSTNDYLNQVPLSSHQISSTRVTAGADAAIANANHIKAQGSHILAIAVGNGVSSSHSLKNLKKVSGPDVYDGNGDFDIATDDIYRVQDFSKLQDALREAAFQLCSPSVTIEKLVDKTPDPNSLGDAVRGAHWEIQGDVVAPGGHDWVLPVVESPGSPSQTDFTDAVGFTTFQWLPNQAGSSTFTATETIQAGFTNQSSATSCSYRTPDAPVDQPLTLTTGDGTFTTDIPQESIVTCRFVNLAVPAPAITLEKNTKGLDADIAPGATIRKGEAITWHYVVTNTGNTTLNNISVTDLQTGPVNAAGPSVNCNGKTILQVGESMDCTATGISGFTAANVDFTGNGSQYANLATVAAVDTYNTPVSANDPSHYLSAISDIAIQKSTNGSDADHAPGPLVAPGSTVNWEYVVTNEGSFALKNVAVTDDRVGGITGPVSGDINSNGILETTETWVYQKQGAAVNGQYLNVGTVTADPPTGPSVSSHDPAHYFGVVTSLDINKSTNDVAADTPPGPSVAIGDSVIWKYVVTNNSNHQIDDWSVTDDQGVAVTCPMVVLPPGGIATCHAKDVAQAGQYGNIGTVSTPNPLDPQGPRIVASNPSHYFGAQPALTLEKFTNGEDADAAPGPFIEKGDPVTWAYKVTNSGDTVVDNIALLDSELGDITGSCPADSLNPGDSITCVPASDLAIEGQYRNLSLVLATGLGEVVGALDPSHYFGAAPGIKVEKLTNGVDADLPPGPPILEGKAVNWVYEIANTGNDPLHDLTLVDDQLGSISCPKISLAPGETTQCVANGTALSGPYANIATVEAIDQNGVQVSDTDPSHYEGYIAAIHVEKSTNGEDADSPIGPIVPVGSPVIWRYEITNPGDTALRHLLLTDDQGVQPIFQSGDTNADGLLEPGEVWVYEAQGTAISGQYANIATVSAMDILENPVEDTDPSHYFGLLLEPSLHIEKSTNGVDADVAPGPAIIIGNIAHFDYVVSNTGNTFLTNIEVTDNQGVLISCPSGNPIPVLEPHISETCTASHVVTQDQYANTGTAMGHSPDGATPMDTDPSHHFGIADGTGIAPGIEIQKSTNGQDADNAPGPSLSVGSVANFNYVVTNTGNTYISNVLVTDNRGVAVDCPSGNPIPLLRIGSSENCTGSATVTSGQYTNIGSVTGDVSGVGHISDTDPSNHFGTAPGIQVEKLTNGVDADLPPGPSVLEGDTVSWVYEITNTGNDQLHDLTLVDDKLGPVTCQKNILDPGEIIQCTANGIALSGQYANVATVAAIDQNGAPVSATDPSHYHGYIAAIHIEKTTNGQDADSPVGPVVPVGDPITWRYEIVNPGDTTLQNIVLTDDQGVLPIFQGGDTNADGLLEPGEVWVYEAQGTAVSGQYANMATVKAIDTLQNPVADTDPSHYFGLLLEPSLHIEKSTNGVDADAAPGPAILVGNVAHFDYVVSNTGNTYLANISVTDDQGVLVTCPSGNPIPVLEPYVSETCTASHVVTQDQYANIGTVTGQSPDGTTPTDTDPSHHFGISDGTAIAPGIELEKSTNGQDADSAPGPFLLVWSVADFEYVVTNTGNTFITNVLISDDHGVVVDCPSGNPIPLLRIGASETCTGSTTVSPDQYTNIGSATGEVSGTGHISDSDPSNHFGEGDFSSPTPISIIHVEKTTNGQDADSPIGQIVPVGNPITWRYEVTNPGDTTLQNLVLTDDRGVLPIFQGGDTNADGLLEPGEVWVYEAQGTAISGQYANIATVQAIDTLQYPVEDTDPSHYFGLLLQPSLHIEKSTNGVDADVAPGPAIIVGNIAHFDYVVSNTGNTYLTDIFVTDDRGATISCPSGNPIPVLEPHVSETCTATHVVTLGQYANIGKAAGDSPDGSKPTDIDPSHHLGVSDGTGVTPGIEIQKSTNGQDADSAPGPSLSVGSVADFEYVITNTGNTYISNVLVTDNRGVAVDCPSGNPIPLLRIGSSETCTGSATVTDGQYTNIGSATGEVPGVGHISDTDPSNHFGETATPTPPKDIPTISALGLGLLALLLSGIGMFAGFARRQ